MGGSVKRERRGGFTLVEILVVVAIFGILATLAVSSFLGMSEKYKVESETKQLYADLMDARARAMQRNRFFFVRMTANGYTIFEDSSPSPDGDGSLGAGDARVFDGSLQHAISTTGGVDNVIFNRNGIAMSTGNVLFSSTANPDYDCITVKETRIKMGKRNGATCNEK